MNYAKFLGDEIGKAAAKRKADLEKKIEPIAALYSGEKKVESKKPTTIPVSNKVRKLSELILADPDLDDSQKNFALQGLAFNSTPHGKRDVNQIRQNPNYQQARLLAYKYHMIAPTDPDELLRTGGFSK